ncbi:MAG: alanine dehydrogenase [Chloroherpetonaceae bacterium]|nr:alanine dehydrogenase [Chthonomonadaceae bacterium]MDW8207533.1 alanine dehydrogenase [Chloroherpetonaceae bacterium]
MIVGVPREIKDNEYRVAMVPSGVETLVEAGHTVLIETGAGLGTGIEDEEYRTAGAEIVSSGPEVFRRAEMVVKVKEPQPSEYDLLREGQILFTYFHFAASEMLTRAMVDRGVVCVAYETIQMPDGTLPLLTPMSEVAGRMAVQEGAKYLERPMEGRGILLAGVPGVPPANVVILGGGVVGSNAAKIAAGFGANVYILDINLERLRYLDDVMPPNVTTIFSNRRNIAQLLPQADLVIGGVLRRGAKAPTLVTREMLKTMKRGAVVVDVAVDQGGCFETTYPTTHSAPTYIVEGVVHYCVANMPGAVAGTSTYALTNETLRYARLLADKGWKQAMRENHALLQGLNVAHGRVTLRDIAEQFGYPYTPAEELIAA